MCYMLICGRHSAFLIEWTFCWALTYSPWQKAATEENWFCWRELWQKLWNDLWLALCGFSASNAL